MRPEDRLAHRGGAIEFLRFPALVFGIAARTRRALYDRGWFHSTRVGVPVVSVGNLTTGGTGKTPMCLVFAELLARRGFRPGILSRGYGAVPGQPNDEALLIARLSPDVAHVEDKDRVAGARRLIERGVTAIVLDDGFQHRRIARDIDVVLVDATRPFGLHAVDGREPVRALLPRGLLREPPSSLDRADLIVVTRSESVAAAELDTLESELARIAPGRPIARASLVLSGWSDERGNKCSIDALRGRDVDVVSALGNPAAFESSVRATGAIVREHRIFADHHRYVADDVRGLPAEGRVLVTSGKDAVKLGPLGVRFHVLESRVEFDTGVEVLSALLDALGDGSKAMTHDR